MVKAVNTDFDLMETHGRLLLADEPSTRVKPLGDRGTEKKDCSSVIRLFLTKGGRSGAHLTAPLTMLTSDA